MRLPPKTAFVSLWFPKPSETFVFREIKGLGSLGLPLKVYTLYGRKRGHYAAFMRRPAAEVERFGARSASRILWAFATRRTRGEGAGLFGRLVSGRAGGERFGENLWAYLCGFYLADRVARDGIRHIHACWASGPATAACVAAQLAGLPFSFTARARDLHLADETLPFKAKRAAFIRCNTRSNIAFLHELVGRRDNVHCVFNGLDLDHAAPAPVSMTPPVPLLAIGRLVEKKGFGDLLHACRSLRDRGVDVALTVVGDGPLRGSLGTLAAGLGIDEMVKFPGFLPFEEVSRLLSRTDMLVAPSVIDDKGDRDGIPNVILEALAHRVPVVATNVAGIGEVIVDGETGRLVPLGDPNALASAMESLIRDRDRALALAEQGRQRVIQCFDAAQSQSRIIELLGCYT